MVIQCKKCDKVFKSNIALEKHENKKTPCHDNKPVAIVNNNINNVYESEFLEDKSNLQFEKLKAFDIKNILKDGQEAKSIIISGARGSGKTTLIQFLYPLLMDLFDIVVFFSFSLHNDLYKDIQEPKFDNYHPQLVKELFYFQKKTKNKLSLCVVMDDMISESIKHDDSLMQLYTRGRNSNISVIITTQHMNIMKNTNRANCSFIFFGKTNTASSRLVLIEDYLLPIIKIPKELGIKTKSAKIDYLDAWVQNYTQDHNFLVIDYFNTGETVYNYKVPL